MHALRIGSPLLVMWFGGLQALNGSLSVGTMLALNALASGFLSPIATLISTALQLQLLRSSSSGLRMCCKRRQNKTSAAWRAPQA